MEFQLQICLAPKGVSKRALPVCKAGEGEEQNVTSYLIQSRN